MRQHAYTIDDVTVIPIARVAGGGVGGGGESAESSDDDNAETGQGFGTGFGLGASPLGVYEIRNGNVTWNPALDVNRIVKGAEVLTAILAVCVSLVEISRR